MKTVRNRTKNGLTRLGGTAVPVASKFQLSAEVGRARRLLLPLGLGGHVQTQRKIKIWSRGAAARQSTGIGSRNPSTNFGEAVV